MVDVWSMDGIAAHGRMVQRWRSRWIALACGMLCGRVRTASQTRGEAETSWHACRFTCTETRFFFQTIPRRDVEHVSS